MSEALIEVAKPFTAMPPSDIDELFEDLSLVAQVWNAAIAPTDELRALELAQVVLALEHDGDSREAVQLAVSIAARKERLYPDDLRFIAHVSVEERDGRAFVEAMSAHFEDQE